MSLFFAKFWAVLFLGHSVWEKITFEVLERKVSESKAVLVFFIFAKRVPKNPNYWILAIFSFFSIIIFFDILKALCLLSMDLTSKKSSGPAEWPKMAAKVPKCPTIAFFGLK